jgi:hypothetical protein
MFPRRILIPVLATLSVALATGVAQAAKCGRVERKAHARLVRGLAACSRVTSLSPADCEAAKWAKYDFRITKAGCPIPPREGPQDDDPAFRLDPRIDRPLVIAIRARDGRPADLAAADRAVLDAFDGYVAVLRRLDKARRVARESGPSRSRRRWRSCRSSCGASSIRSSGPRWRASAAWPAARET